MVCGSYGTAIESFGKLGDSIYFHDTTPSAKQLWIVQYVSSVVRWRDAGVNVTQAVSYTYGESAVSLAVKITIGELPAAEAAGGDTTINLRIPGWAVPATSTVELNGEALVKAGSAKTSSFLQIKSAFKPGDVITASFGMAPRFVKLNDNRTAYDNVGGIIYGPYALVALTDGDYALKANVEDIGSWLKLTPGAGAGGAKTMRFTATGSDGKTMTLLPLNRVVDQNYTAHLNISADATQCLCGGADSCASSNSGTRSGTPSLTFDGSSLLGVGGATVTGGDIRSGDPGGMSDVLMKAPFVGHGTITGVELSFRYTIGYNAAKGQKGATIALVYHSQSSDCPNAPPAPPANDPNATVLWTSPAYLEPKFDVTHKYSAPVNVSLSGLHLDVLRPGARLGLHFEDNDHNMQVLLPIEVKLTWANEHRHVH